MHINLVDMARRPRKPVGPIDVSQLPHLAGWRKHRKMTQTALANAAGYTQGMISQWEGGESDVPLGAVAKLAKALKTTPLQLIFFPPGEETIYDIIESLPPGEHARAIRMLKSLREPD